MAIIRIPRSNGSDERESFVLVNVRKAGGSRSLDLKLVATDGSEPFEVTVKHSKIQTLRSKNSPGTETDWEAILESILLEKIVEENDIIRDIEAVAAVSDDAITISFRKKIDGIIQRFGQLIIPQNSEAEVELFEWCGEALEGNLTSSHALTALQTKYDSQRCDIAELTAQLKALTDAKATHEHRLLEKFAMLLNEKKAKIRDQQRLLASANVDPEKLTRVQESRTSHGTSVREAGTSRAGKRKAGRNERLGDSNGNDDDGFEKMDVDVDQILNDSEREDAMTPDENDEDEEETADESAEEIPAPRTKSKLKSKGKASASASTHKSTMTRSDEEKEDSRYIMRNTRQATNSGETTPPRRTLPFQQKAASATSKTNTTPAQDTVADGDETASEDDDEL